MHWERENCAQIALLNDNGRSLFQDGDCVYCPGASLYYGGHVFSPSEYPQIFRHCKQKNNEKNPKDINKVKQETWKFQKNQVFQLLHETRKTFQVQNIELMYFSFNNIYDI